MDERQEQPAMRFRRPYDAPAGTNPILDTVAETMTRALWERGFALRAPVVARFRRDRTRSTGVEVVVRLREPERADAARAFLVARFPDPLSELIVR